MANKSQAASDLRRFATFVKGLTDAADTLDEMQKLDELAAATDQRVTTEQAALADVEAQVKDARVTLADVKKAAADTTNKAKVRADAIIDAAEQQAAIRAQAIIESAAAECTSLLAEADRQRAALIEQVSGLSVTLVDRTAELATVEASIAAAQDELVAVEGKLAAARESISRMLL